MWPHVWSVRWLTDRCKSTAAFSHCRTASNESDYEKQGSNSNDGDCRDESVHVFEEVIVVVICDEDIGSNITQDACSRLREESSSNTVALKPDHDVAIEFPYKLTPDSF